MFLLRSFEGFLNRGSPIGCLVLVLEISKGNRDSKWCKIAEA
jgi:hypothetical protein